MEQHQFASIKCSVTEYKAGETRTTGSGLSRFLNLQNQRFATSSCANRSYTEMYGWVAAA
ncbi:MAG TPA: GTP-binding protein [Dehalococcoidia bacterium]|nr:zinc ribbon domain-containing protein [SAR202 cluster bacterium]HIM81087.1 GTP-binding protein [Dehalococcoidia bacterium]